MAALAAIGLSMVPLSAAAEDDQNVDRQVQQEVAAKGTASFFVTFKAKADVDGAAAGRTGHDRVRAVVAALKATADQAQAPVLAKIRDEQAAGHVSSFTAFWAVDAILVTGDAQAAHDLANLPQTEFVLPNREVTPDLGVGAPLAAAKASKSSKKSNNDDPTACAGTIEPVSWNVASIRADQAWDEVTGDGVLVGMIDTGADYLHPALAANYAQDGPDHRFSWFDSINHRAVPYDDNGHGTHTTGTVAGKCGIGVAPDAKWIMAKVFPASGGSTEREIVPAMEWMLAPGGDPDHAPQIVSNSWGSTASTSVFRPVVQAWVAAGILPVFSNGNAGPGPSSVGSPADYPESFGVGNLDYGVVGGIAVTTSPGGPGTLLGVPAGPPAATLNRLHAPYHFVGLACAPLTESLAGKIALVERGTCSFESKHNNARAAGALAMVVQNNVPGAPPSMAITTTGIPAVAVSQSDGAALRAFEATPGSRLDLDPLHLVRSAVTLNPPVISGSSSRGPSSIGEIVKPDVSAPGSFVFSAGPRDLVPTGYRFLSGTSMAAPHVAGTAALMLQANGDLTVAQLEQLMRSTAHSLGSPIPNNDTGYGAIDAFDAVAAAMDFGN